jgi:hypothetical protein
MMARWLIVQGRSRATVNAPDYAAAKDRAAYIGFKDPETIKLIEESESK